MAVNVLAPVRAIKKTPAVDSTSAASPALANAAPGVTCTPEPTSWPANTLSVDVPPPGDVGDPPQADNSVASVAPEATWHAPAQN
jgi:hypothetical protein